MITAVIFDMGGTLMRSVLPGSGSWREYEAPGIRGIYRYLIEQGHPIASHEDDFVEAMFARLTEGWEQSTGGHISLRAVDWIAAGAADHALTLDEAALFAAARRYALPIRAGLVAAEGAASTLAALRDAGYRIGLISNTIWPAELHMEDLAEIGVLQYLENMIFSGEIGIWKPSRQIFQHALDALGVAPEQAVFVGDSPHEDIMGAHAAGMRAIWIRSGEFPLGDVQPDASIETLPELLPILEHWRA
ncbi:MAG: HAD family hydrolase [Roseiflexaceae bacterium]